ncbi:ParB/RepB/Spo0J family partition protein [Pararhodobacter sp. CCB-MM2]|uniref:ParB/RepB/Spo0J family partition protein n=1 Tax=Pararhodobacter sp. CCB-MM2 TaxID=1786003 RepID=UPI00082B44E2|nr:ParB/RepB/Spo0J family partition protein [Pararhodobacter sp. CCB-MM2]
MSKRRIFDIGFPADETPAAQPAAPAVPAGTEASARRGPMAAAITENADALRERAQIETRIRAENDELAHEFVRLRKLGLVVDLIDLDAIRAEELTRDRAAGRDEDIDELKESIREIGLSNPIRVVARGDGFELIQGFRRLMAFRELHAETGDERFAKVPAGLVPPGDGIDMLYRRMVDENMVRRDISFAEMAELARAYHADPETPAGTLDAAIAALFGSANRQKRVYIRNFAKLLDALGGALMHAPSIPRALGLSLWKAVDRDPSLVARVSRKLAAEPQRDADRELAILREMAESPAPVSSEVEAKPRKPGAKTTLRVPHGGMIAQCTASDGRVELRLPRDFSAVDRMRLEKAVAAFLASLDD